MPHEPTIGELRWRVTFQEDTGAKGVGGFRSASWANIGSIPTVSAKIEPLGSGEEFAAGKETVRSKFKITVRFRTDITSAMRISTTLHGQSRLFDIDGIEYVPFEQRRWTVLSCTELPGI